MKNPSRLLVLVALTAFACAPTFVRAQDAPPPPDQGGPPPDQGGQVADQGGGDDDQGASFQTFYDQLGDQGQWIQTDNYGYVFQPTVSDPDWAPYTDGHWVYTDAGWTWASDEPWGWATYHYGRWANIDGTGWVWVPGYRWAPAWVSWRYGGGYAGWAPLPPETFVGVEYGGGGGDWNTFHFGNDVDVNFGIGAGCYNFVNVGYLGERNYHGHYLDRHRNYTVINNTTNVTNINVTNNYYRGAGGNFRNVSTGGPSFDEVNAHAHTHVQRARLENANRAGRSTLQGNSLAVFAPHMNPGSLHTARPAQVGQNLNHPTFNRGTSISNPLAVNASLKPAPPSAEAISEAHAAREHAPKGARIATENTQVSTPITQPLTSMQPVAPTHHRADAGTPAQDNLAPQQPASAGIGHPSDGSAFTGETQKPAQANHPQAENPNNGGQVFHQQPVTPTYHPQVQNEGGQVYHPQGQEPAAPIHHPQVQNEGGQVYHPQGQEAPTTTHHPQVQNEGGQVYHPQGQEAPTTTHHPQVQNEGGQVYHQQQNQFQPSQNYHQQPQVQPQAAPTFHPQSQAAPTFHSQPQEAPAQTYHPQGQNQGGGGQSYHPQAQPQHEAAPQTHTQSAPAPATKPAPAAAPAANGNKNGQNQQGH